MWKGAEREVFLKKERECGIMSPRPFTKLWDNTQGLEVAEQGEGTFFC